MNLVLFLYIAAFFTLTLGEFGQFPFGKTDFSVSATDILLTFALTASLIWNIGISKSLVIPKNFKYLMVFWAVCFISLLFSADLSGLFYLVRFIIYSATFYLTFHLVKARILGPQEFLTLVKVTTITLAVIGIFQLVIFPDLESLSIEGYDPHKARIFSTFLDPNFLGAFLSFGFVLYLYELTCKKYTNIRDYIKENRINLVWLMLLGITIIFTFSRSTYLMITLSIPVILAVKNRKLLLVFAILSVFLYFSFPAFNMRINGAINIDASAAHRFSSWDKGLVIFQQNPILGVGFNNIRNYSINLNLVELFSPDGGNSGAGIDSSLIFLLATTGLIGFSNFILLVFKILSDFFSDATSNLPGKAKFLSLPLLSLALGLTANSFFINSLFFPPILFLLFSIIGVYYGLKEGDGEGAS